MKGLLVAIVAPSQAGKDTIAGQMAKHLSTHGKHNPEVIFASAYKTRDKRATDPSYIHAIGKNGEIPVLKKNQISAEIFGQTICYDKSEINELLDQGKIVFLTTCSPELGAKLKLEYGEMCDTIFVRAAETTIYRNDRVQYMALIEQQRKTGKEMAWNDEFDPEVVEKMQRRVKEYETLRPLYSEFMKHADNITHNWWTLFLGDWNTKIQHKASQEIERQCAKIIQIVKYINMPHTKAWEDNPDLAASEKERSLPPFSLQPEFMEYYEEKREDN